MRVARFTFPPAEPDGKTAARSRSFPCFLQQRQVTKPCSTFTSTPMPTRPITLHQLHIRLSPFKAWSRFLPLLNRKNNGCVLNCCAVCAWKGTALPSLLAFQTTFNPGVHDESIWGDHHRESIRSHCGDSVLYRTFLLYTVGRRRPADGE